MKDWKKSERAKTYIFSKNIESCKFCELNYVMGGKPGYCQQYGYRYHPNGELIKNNLHTSASLAAKCKAFVPSIRRIVDYLGVKNLRTVIEKYDDGGERWYEKESMG